jgi:hypothetical protein
MPDDGCVEGAAISILAGAAQTVVAGVGTGLGGPGGREVGHLPTLDLKRQLCRTK